MELDWLPAIVILEVGSLDGLLAIVVLEVGSLDGHSSTVVMKVGSVVSGIVLGDTAILTELKSQNSVLP